MTDLRRTPLSDWHEAHGGRIVDFAGFAMPVQYEGVMAEHRAVRDGCGLFDISHMGELMITGPGSRQALDRLVTNNVAKLEPGKALYSAVCGEDGGVLDDVLVYCLSDEHFMVVANASNREKIADWLGPRLGAEVAFEDVSDATALAAVQGPRSLDVLRDWPRLEPHLAQVEALGYYELLPLTLGGAECILSRTGYTGEQGYELYMPNGVALRFWEEILSAGEAHGLRPVGLGARDTLRLEAAYSLYGHELDEEHSPFESNIGWVVRLKAGDFVGKEALVAQKAQGVPHRILGFTLEGRNIARAGAPILRDGQRIGTVTSGTFSPTLERGIGLARVRSEADDEGLEVEIRGKRLPMSRAEIPFVASRVKD